MQRAPLLELNSPETKELAELLLFQHDVQTSIESLRLWTTKQPAFASSPDDNIIAAALFRDSVVQFIGCFDASAPFKLSSDIIYAGHDGAREYFQWLKDIRDAYAAHKFGRERQCVVGIVQMPTGRVVGHMTSIYQGLNDNDGAHEIAAFMNITLQQINFRIRVLTDSVQAAATKLTTEEINALPVARLHGIDPEDFRKGRKR